MVTAGPYSLVRHPSYTAWYLVISGNLLLLYGSGSFFVETGMLRKLAGKAVAAYVTLYMGWVCGGMLWRTITEDKMMKQEFGAEWEEWASKTRYRLIPGIY